LQRVGRGRSSRKGRIWARGYKGVEASSRFPATTVSEKRLNDSPLQALSSGVKLRMVSPYPVRPGPIPQLRTGRRQLRRIPRSVHGLAGRRRRPGDVFGRPKHEAPDRSSRSGASSDCGGGISALKQTVLLAVSSEVSPVRGVSSEEELVQVSEPKLLLES
jgi:hypothetical protein